MLGDVLLITEKHTWAAEAIVRRVGAMNGPKNVIAISGESGSGKSELAHEVARQLKIKGTPAKVIHSDNYYKTHLNGSTTSSESPKPVRKTGSVPAL